MTVVFVSRAGTWFQFTSSWLFELRGCFVDCCCYWCCFYQGQQACKHLGKWTVSLIVNSNGFIGFRGDIVLESCWMLFRNCFWKPEIGRELFIGSPEGWFCPSCSQQSDQDTFLSLGRSQIKCKIWVFANAGGFFSCSSLAFLKAFCFTWVQSPMSQNVLVGEFRFFDLLYCKVETEHIP